MPPTSSAPAFWKPGTSRPASSLDRTTDSHLLLTSLPSSSSSTLPIHSSRLSILHALETSQILILVGETGSGKTTQLPPILSSSGWSAHGTIACTQPRRVAATTVAARVATEMGVKLGQEVGYTVRFEDNSSATTKIRYMTDGALFRECLRDPLLTRYSVVMVDEAHERSLYTDLLLGVLKKICRKRRELRVIVSSATIDALSFRDFFDDEGGVTILKLDGGRTFPVHTAYLNMPCQDYVEETVDTLWRIHLTEPQGDILAFLTGRSEINSALQQLADRQADLPPSAARMHLLPLHAGLTPQEQMDVFSPAPSPSMRKVVVATNIAEASLTLDGIIYIVDCGLVKQHTTSSLEVVPISRASAVQRTGRAGRTRPGKCFRLYTEDFFHIMLRATPPELTRIELDTAVLMLKGLGVENLVRFEWVPPSPPPESLARALQRLLLLGALDEYARLTRVGEMMSELPLPPHLAKVLVASTEEKHGCAQEMLTVLSMMSITHPFIHAESVETQLSVRQFQAVEGDPLTLLNVYLSFIGAGSSRKWCTKHRLNYPALLRAVNIRGQLQRFLHRFSLSPLSSIRASADAVERITRCLCVGLFANLARYNPASMTYTTALGGEEVWVHPESVFFNRRPEEGKWWVIYGEATRQGEKTMIRDVSVLGGLEWVTDAVPGFYDVKSRWGGGP